MNIVEKWMLKRLNGRLNISGQANGDAITWDAAAEEWVSGASSNPSGLIAMYGAGTAPTGWLLCNGAAVSRTTYANLFSVIGTTYGAGNGSTTFNVPNLTQKFPLGKANSGTGSSLGGTGGAIDHNHTMAHTHSIPSHVHGLNNHTHSVPSHSHPLSGNAWAKFGYNLADAGKLHWGLISQSWTSTHSLSYSGVSPNSSGSVPTATELDGNTDSGGSGTTGAASGNTASGGSGTSGSASSSTTSANNPPYLVVNFIISI